MYAVIMAGGIGTRFWPLSRKHFPKQFLSIVHNQSLLRETIERIKDYFSYDKIIIVGNKEHRDVMFKEASMLPPENILCEPHGKNTAPCIAYAAAWIAARNPNEKMFILPADHSIEPQEKLLESIKNINEFLDSNDVLVALGIKPTSAHTGYGYIELGETKINNSFYSLRSFTEKPDRKSAENFLKQGTYLWNSGMFAWRVSTILKAFEEFLPHIYTGIQSVASYLRKEDHRIQLQKAYKQCESISIDYGIIEKVKNVSVYKCDFNWNDVGSFGSLYQLSEKDEDGNFFENDHYLIDTRRSYIRSKKFVATIGIEDIIVIDTNDALLICKRERSEEIKKVVEYLKENKKNLL